MTIHVETTPVFEKNLEAYQSGYEIICNEGGSRCFAPNQMVVTSNGPKPIKSIKRGDIVLSFNEIKNRCGWQPVVNVFPQKNIKPCVEIILKDGTAIRCTIDHKFYFEGGWHSAKHILSLWDERNMEAS